MKSFINDLLNTVLSKGGIIIFGLANSIIIARWLGPELNGTIAALAVYPSLFMTIGSLGIRQSTAYYTGKKAFDDTEIKNAIIQLWLFSCIISVIGCYFLITYFSRSGDNIILVCLALLPIPFTLFKTYSSGIFLGKNQIQQFNKINWLPTLIIFIATVIMVILLGLSINGAMLAMFIGPLCMAVILVFKVEFLKTLSFKINFKAIKALLSLGLIYATAFLVINLNYKIDIILLDRLSTSYETGIYGKGSGLIQYLWQIPMLLSTIIFARSANSKNSDGFSRKVIVLLRISFIVIGIGCIILAIAAPFIITLLFGESFYDSSFVLRYLIPGVLLLTIFKVLNMDLAGRGKPWLSMISMVPALLLNIILNIILIPQYGANGAAITSTISYSVAATTFLFVYAKETKIHISEILLYRLSDFEYLKRIPKEFNRKQKTP